MAAEIKILIIDQHPAVRRALAARLKSMPHIEILAATHDIQKGLEHARVVQPDIILLDLPDWDDDSSNPVQSITTNLSNTAVGVIVLASIADERKRRIALKAGAKRYLLKDIDSTRLVAEIEAVAREVRPSAT